MKNGFTLIELLAVIIVLAVISLITVVAVDSTISKSKETLSDTQKTNIEEAAKAYYLKEGMSNNDTCVDVSKLIEKGYIEGNVVKDPKDKEEMTGSVKITYEANQYSYEYQEETCGVCTLSDEDNNGKYSIGDIVECTIGDETDKFYVIEEAPLTTSTIQVLTEKNINTTTYRQSDDAGEVAFSTINYWVDENATLLSQYGSEYPANIYNENNDIIYPIVEKYVNYLNTKLTNATGSLLTYNQIKILGCNPDKFTCNSDMGFGALEDPAPEWVYSTSYWLGFCSSFNTVWYVAFTGSFDTTIYNGYEYSITSIDGIRPVITISTSDIG